MKIEQLENCIESLKAILLQVRDEVDPGIAAELESIITRLDFCKEEGGIDIRIDAQLVTETLMVLGRVAGSIAAVSQLLDRFLK